MAPLPVRPSKQLAPGHVPHERTQPGAGLSRRRRLHRFLGREDDAIPLGRSSGFGHPDAFPLAQWLFVGVSWAVTAARLPRIRTGFPFAEQYLLGLPRRPASPVGQPDSTGNRGATQVVRPVRPELPVGLGFSLAVGRLSSRLVFAPEPAERFGQDRAAVAIAMKALA